MSIKPIINNILLKCLFEKYIDKIIDLLPGYYLIEIFNLLDNNDNTYTQVIKIIDNLVIFDKIQMEVEYNDISYNLDSIYNNKDYNVKVLYNNLLYKFSKNDTWYSKYAKYYTIYTIKSTKLYIKGINAYLVYYYLDNKDYNINLYNLKNKYKNIILNKIININNNNINIINNFIIGNIDMINYDIGIYINIINIISKLKYKHFLFILKHIVLNTSEIYNRFRI